MQKQQESLVRYFVNSLPAGLHWPKVMCKAGLVRQAGIGVLVYWIIGLLDYSKVLAQVDLKTDPAFASVRTFDTYGALVTIIVKNSFVIAGVIAFFLLVFGGFRVIMGAGAGDTKQLDQGKQAIVGAVVGLLIIVGSLWIVQIIEVITGLKLLSP